MHNIINFKEELRIKRLEEERERLRRILNNSDLDQAKAYTLKVYDNFVKSNDSKQYIIKEILDKFKKI